MQTNFHLQKEGSMVAIRGTHLLNPKDFDVKKWCDDLHLPKDVEHNLITAWQFSCEKIQRTHPA